MPRTTPLEEELTVLTRQFVARIVAAIRNASFADVASFSWDAAEPPRAVRPPKRAAAERPPRAAKASAAPPSFPESRSRQTAEKRAELASRVLQVLTKAGAPMGVRALSSELGVAPDLLGTPLKELRAAGKIEKHGDKRSTTYGVT